MNCPVCQKTMVELDFGVAHVDVCKEGCKGIWFDWTELEKLDEKHEGLGKALEDAINSEHHKVENRSRINCPKCNMEMVAHLYKDAKMVTIDECYGCAGFFLDSGELEIIRNNHATDEEREKCVQGMLLNIPDYVENKQKLENEKQNVGSGALSRAHAIGKLFHIIR